MADYQVRFFTGDYPARNEKANKWGADLYIDFHENSASPSASYTLVEYTNPKAKAFALSLSNRMAEVIGHKGGGKTFYVRSGARGHVCIGGFHGIGVISEPLFVSNKEDLAWLDKPANQTKLAAAMVGAIRTNFPKGAKVALSVGHIGKTSSPSDRGARAGKHTEAYYAQIVAKLVAELLPLTPATVKTPAKAPVAPTKENPPMLRFGSKGSWVRVLQALLRKHGSKVVVDGDFGSATRTAVRWFQTKHLLLPDGVVGPKTWKKLGY